jgi:hypothetical protein
MTLVTSIYIATILVWRDKVLFDRVHPTTVVHCLDGDREVNTYAGPFKVLERSMERTVRPTFVLCRMLRIRLTRAASAPLLLTTDIPITQSIPEGSSRLEPEMTPSVDLLFEYSTWSEIADA